ncbi:ABC transporter substrate-binding protein [Myxococcota bacterium]|nr:ABC transporter substrate-binding protein [Myxococcota bacterium]
MTKNDAPDTQLDPQNDHETTSEVNAAEASQLHRRGFLRGAVAAATGVGALMTGLPKNWGGRAWASDAPEQPNVSVGFVAVQSCAPIVVAHEKGIFKKHGITSKISKENGWAAARDKVVSGENQASHLKYAQPYGSTMGLSGAPKIPMLAPITMSRNGSIFMVAAQLKGRLTKDPQTWKAVADEMKAKGEAFTIALPQPFGWHGMMYRHFLGNAGINADKDLKVVTLPPAQMVQNMKIGQMQACAMVEPWGVRGVADKVSVIPFYGHELWKDHPVKTFGFLESFADKNPKTTVALLRAILEAAAWCDKFENRAEVAKMLAPPTYLNTPEATILPGLMGDFDWGDGRKKSDKTETLFFNKDNYPQPREAKWFISSFRRWGYTEGEPDYDGITKKVARPELYTTAAKQLGVTAHAQNDEPIKFWDGTVFDHKKAAEYAKSFKVHSLKG